MQCTHMKADASTLKKLGYEPLSEYAPKIVEKNIKTLKTIGITPNNSHSKKYERIKAMITEIIGNAIEHGFKNEEINYWITTDKSKGKITFTIVDLGIGIARSQKKAMHRWWHFLRSDLYIAKKTLHGTLPSSTKESDRGRGLPEMLKTLQEKMINDFVLVSNKASICYKNDKMYTKKIPTFAGTYYSWSVSKN